MNQHTINGLFRACETGDLQHLAEHYKKNPNNEKVSDENHVTPLQVASANNQVKFMYPMLSFIMCT